MESDKQRGHVYVLSAALFLAVSAVATHRFLKNINPIVFAFYCFSFVTLVSFVIRVAIHRELGSFLASIRRNSRHVFILNMTTALDWVLYLIALRYIDGSYTNALCYGVVPLTSLVLSRRIRAPSLLLSLLILILLFLMGCKYLTLDVLPTFDFLVATALAVIAGIAVGGTTVSLKELSRNNVPIIDVILLRYLATVVVSAVIIVARSLSFWLPVDALAKTLLIAFLFVLLPSYLVQKGFKYLSAFSVAVISSSIPALTYVFSIGFGFRFDIVQMIYILALSVLLTLYATRKTAGGDPTKT